MTTLYLIRHSVKYPRSKFDSFNGSDGNYLKDEKIILSVEGEKRAEILSHEHELENIDIVYSSNMVRAISTAKYLCENQNLHINVDERLNERTCGKPNSDKYPDWFSRQYKDKTFKTEGGESQEEVSSRVYECINEILLKNKNKRIAVFAHGYAITYVLLKWCELVDVTEDRKLTLKFKGKIFMDKIINAPEVFKLEFDNSNNLIDIDLIEFDDLPYVHGGI